jgi:hypothetical protein
MGKHTQIVMDHTGDTRREFDAADKASIAEAEKRFKELTGAGETHSQAVRRLGAEEANRRRDAAEARGLQLLKEWLPPAELDRFNRQGFFEVTGCHSGRRYRITQSTSYNVYPLDAAGIPVGVFCFMPEGHMVIGHVMLAQKIALETDERAALKLANQRPVWPHGGMRLESNPGIEIGFRACSGLHR